MEESLFNSQLIVDDLYAESWKMYLVKYQMPRKGSSLFWLVTGWLVVLLDIILQNNVCKFRGAGKFKQSGIKKSLSVRGKQL